MSQNETIIPYTEHQHEFAVSIWENPGNSKYKTVILRESNPERCYHCEHEDMFVEIPFNMIDLFISDLLKWRTKYE